MEIITNDKKCEDAFSEFYKIIGGIVVNLQSLEVAIRLFLYEAEGVQDKTFKLHDLHEGDRVPCNPLTNYDSLKTLIEKIKLKLKELKRDEQIDYSLVKLRDALAHGRLTSSSLQPPRSPEDHFKLYKFSRVDKKTNMVRTEVALDISLEELKKQQNLVGNAIKDVVRIGHSLGFKCFPETFPDCES